MFLETSNIVPGINYRILSHRSFCVTWFEARQRCVEGDSQGDEY